MCVCVCVCVCVQPSHSALSLTPDDNSDLQVFSCVTEQLRLIRGRSVTKTVCVCVCV